MIAKTPVPHGVTFEQAARIRAVLRAWTCVEEAVLYGSRSRGTQRTYSDLDLCILSRNMDIISLARLSEDLEDLDLPWKIDLTLRRTHRLQPAADPRFSLAHQVAATGVLFYERASVDTSG